MTRSRTGRPAIILSVLAILLAIVAGCARPGAERAAPVAPAPPPPRGPWIELGSRHFVMRTDIAVHEATRRLDEFEQVYQAFTEIAFPTDESRSGVLHIVLFADSTQYHAIGPRGSEAVFSVALPNDLEPEPTVRMSGDLVGETRRVFQHELTHHFIRRSLPRCPVWLNEGMAEFYSTLDISPGHVTLGAARPDVGITKALVSRVGKINGVKAALLSFRDLPKVQHLLAMDALDFRNTGLFGAALDPGAGPRNYVAAWGLVHLMMTGPEGYRARFGHYVEALTRGRAPSLAWGDAFGDIDSRGLQRSYDEHITADTVAMLRTRFEPRPVPPPSVRAMSEAEIHILRARLIKWTEASAKGVREHLDAAERAEPGSAEVRYWQALFLNAMGDLDAAGAQLVAALAKSPEEPRYLLGLARVALTRHAPAADMTALAERLSRAARTAAQLDGAAELLLGVSRPDDALPLVERAIKADPLCLRCVLTHAELLAAKGRGDEADAELERAIVLLPEDVPAKVIQTLRAHMQHPPATERKPESGRSETKPGSVWEEQ